jgi:hypothetical protein
MIDQGKHQFSCEDIAVVEIRRLRHSSSSGLIGHPLDQCSGKSHESHFSRLVPGGSAGISGRRPYQVAKMRHSRNPLAVLMSFDGHRISEMYAKLISR